MASTGTMIVGQETTAAMFSRQLPVIYAAWAKAMPGGIERASELVASELVASELDASLEKAKWTRDSLREFISDTTDGDPRQEADHSKRCSACLDDYSPLGTGLVALAWIAFTECTITRHRFKCACRDFLQSAGLPARPPPPESSITSDPQDNASTDSDAEEWAEACEKQVDDSQDDANYRPSSDTERADEELAHGSDSDGSGDTSWKAACEPRATGTRQHRERAFPRLRPHVAWGVRAGGSAVRDLLLRARGVHRERWARDREGVF